MKSTWGKVLFYFCICICFWLIHLSTFITTLPAYVTYKWFQWSIYSRWIVCLRAQLYTFWIHLNYPVARIAIVHLYLNSSGLCFIWMPIGNCKLEWITCYRSVCIVSLHNLYFQFVRFSYHYLLLTNTM